jgi:hypothetical protein
MNRFEPSIPRGAFGVAAVAMTAITMGVMVVLPAILEGGSADPSLAAAAATRASTELAIAPARIDVANIVDREEQLNPARTTLGAQELYGKHHTLSSGSRSHI